ncbi:MAG: DEAD/DEAH box helicase family protein [Verrucomicrobiales bacterium]|nr:DEAD/DEAH box helicase family protein [Verrucomicrobiales bacterium]
MNQHSTAAEKIALFRSLFQGREDVYPRRFESRKTGRAGYQPACANEWIRGVCEKPRVKCSNCLQQRWLPVTDEVVRWHLSGRDDRDHPFVMGVYPMLRDESCQFLAVDFDRDHWDEDALAYLETCRAFQVPAALERSRSGNGGHVWLFFEEVVPAILARKLGSFLLTETMERRPELGLRSYDRLFPNQDTLPQGGFGNLIALPLQRLPRNQGNSVFVGEDLQPHADQWAFLASMQRLAATWVRELAQQAEQRGRIVGVRVVATEEDSEAPWTAPPSRTRKELPIQGPLPSQLDLVLADQIYVPKRDLPPGLRNRLIRVAAFQNPEFYRAQAMRLPTYDKPRVISCAEDLDHHIGLPRGCLDEIKALLMGLTIRFTLRDERVAGTELPVTFQGQLRPEQQEVAEAVFAHDNGVLAATTAFGKTVIAAWLIARRHVNTLILVHRQQLLEQWVERLAALLGLCSKQVGRLGGGRKKLTGAVDVALIQSLVRKGVVDDRVADYGHLVIDECHHLSARSFELVARRAKARFVTGLSATVVRKDGHHPIIFMQCGPVRCRIDAKRQAAVRPFTHQVIVRPTAFRAPPSSGEDARVEYQALLQALSQCESRNRMICDDVLGALHKGRWPLVLTERKEHLEELGRRLETQGARVIRLQGGMRKQALKEALADIGQAEDQGQRVLLATGRFVGEGFDDARLDTLFVGLPISWRGTVAQYVGRLHRLHEGKREVVVFDYADLEVPMLSRMFDRRCQGYEAVGYTVLLPASALPGWPTDVPLPVDPQWKRDYAASVKRLIRDGVDTPLANLFVRAARPDSTETEGVARARSASEAFLFTRLETLAETAGRFRLNASLPIPFDAKGCMEVDFLCAEAALVIELDGAQHLADAVAYRRDRRKDALLQEHGMHVLRFLAADLASDLNSVLDTILRALARWLGPPSV